ncbi:RNA polymerase sigma factor [Breznakia pachnodae]|uniref:RNA polymerase sigma factor (Sigma-70 family) n=1 Tax=Breznakia pachnodae TaxID=265178 RepID=A0ABU0DZS4_9FIRM|nr:RNA polymerase sigma factor [Breznakia pachnodae]MDQ0360130.1 RNA polymerase sigma factor (sigma-70 family) [Breznakia pachnodae]
MENKKNISNEVISRAINGDSEAFSEIYHFYYRHVYFIALQYFRNEEIAKDIAQDVFIRVYKSINGLRAPEAFYTWLYRMTYRMCQNQNRKKMKISDLGGDITVEDFADTKSIGIMEEIENNRVKEILSESIDTLSEPLKEVALLRFFEGLKLQEIADILDIPKATVSTRLVRIKEALRTDLKSKGVQTPYVLVLITPAALSETYTLLFEPIRNISEQSVSLQLQEVLSKVAVVTTGSGFSIFTKAMICGGVILTLLGGGALWLNTPDQSQEPEKIETTVIDEKKEDVVAIAQIVSVEYEKEYTNKSIDLLIELSSDNYNQILVNNENTTTIHTNGTYVIEVEHEGKIVDSHMIEINNIDKHSPLVISDSKNENYIIYLSDDISGVNPDSIKYYYNESLADSFVYDEQANSITFKNDRFATHKFYIRDNANNLLEIEVK